MISNSTNPNVAVMIAPPVPPTPIVAIPLQPGPADMMVQTSGSELRTIHSFKAIEACERALATARRANPDVFCVSTVPPPAEPEMVVLLDISAESELVGLQFFPSMRDCRAAMAKHTPPAGATSRCDKGEMH